MPESPAARQQPSVRVVGHGSCRVIISSGWIADSSLFEPFCELIDEDQITLALVEHRGYGSSAHLTAQGLRTSADDVLTAADTLGWEKFTVLGHSMGGLVAQHLAATAPHRLDGIILLSSVPASGGQLDEQTREQRRQSVRSANDRHAMISTNAACSPPLADHIWKLSLKTTSEEAMLSYLEDFSRADFASEFTENRIPALVLTGELDPAVTTRSMRNNVLPIFPLGELVELQGVGHYAMQQNPGKLLDAVEQFLGRMKS